MGARASRSGGPNRQRDRTLSRNRPRSYRYGKPTKSRAVRRTNSRTSKRKLSSFQQRIDAILSPRHTRSRTAGLFSKGARRSIAQAPSTSPPDTGGRLLHDRSPSHFVRAGRAAGCWATVWSRNRRSRSGLSTRGGPSSCRQGNAPDGNSGPSRRPAIFFNHPGAQYAGRACSSIRKPFREPTTGTRAWSAICSRSAHKDILRVPTTSGNSVAAVPVLIIPRYRNERHAEARPVWITGQPD
jgi:hypothetical protein